MAEVIGKVIEKKNNSFVIEINRFSACGNCTSKGHCRLTDNTDRVFISLKYDKSLNVGDNVILETKDSSIILLSILFYLFPVIMLSVGIIIFGRITDNQIFSAIAGLTMGAISFFIIFIIDKKLGKKIKHTIKRVIK